MRRQALWRMLLAAAFLVLVPWAAQAADITMDGTTCTLADAITAANTDVSAGGCPAGSGADTITLQADVTLAAALPQISSTVTIEGGGHFISGNKDVNIGRVLYITDTGNLTLNKTIVKDGKLPSSFGGGIYNNGTVALNDSTVSGNKGNGGGGICNKGTFILISSTINGNIGGSGGGILNQGLFTMTNSTVRGNNAYNVAGGLTTILMACSR